MLVAGSVMPIALLDLVRQITGTCLVCLGCYHARLAKLFVDGSSLRSFSFTVSYSLKVLPNPQPGVSFFISSQKYMKSGELKWITEVGLKVGFRITRIRRQQRTIQQKRVYQITEHYVTDEPCVAWKLLRERFRRKTVQSNGRRERVKINVQVNFNLNTIKFYIKIGFCFLSFSHFVEEKFLRYHLSHTSLTSDTSFPYSDARDRT